MSDGPKNKKETDALEQFRIWCEKDKKSDDKQNCSKIDPSDEQDWFSLSLGFFAALGLSNSACHRLALHARYDLQYWRP